MNKQEKIAKALRGDIPAEPWMVQSRMKSYRDADSYGNSIGDSAHVDLATENYREAQKLKGMLLCRITEKE